MKSMLINLGKLTLRVLALILMTFVSAVLGLILGAIIGGNLAGLYELLSGYAFVFNGREGYEATGQIGFILGAFIGSIASSVYLFRERAGKSPLQSG